MRMTSQTDPVGNETVWVYDLLGRVESETNELNKTRSFTQTWQLELPPQPPTDPLQSMPMYDPISRGKGSKREVVRPPAVDYNVNVLHPNHYY